VKVLGYVLLGLAAAGAHLCVLKPELPERVFRWLLSVLARRKPRPVFLPYYEVVKNA
jgi:hypothetical protein